ncbi:transmembrane protein 185B-like [Nilaparvata lugens]|uniref:transmembrane protein 185B-like n=1 Tax=Nilaparvata lugens TaxID=108931 RepID=UPI00193DC5DB|nr:transmembrane protein 185B-like [Nilaparvata lugens]
MNLQTIFRDFNPSKFIVHSSLMVFTALFALRLDGTINWSYWTVFSPIWFWKFMVIAGATVGSYVWWRYPHFRLEGEAYIHYKAMLVSLAQHLILLRFELLVCNKLQSGHHSWILVFIPLIFLSIVSIAVCIWAVKHDRSFELELFCAVNMLQFIFLSLRLDGFTSWSWVVVFVPLWIVMCLSLVGLFYIIIYALFRTQQLNARLRKMWFNLALAYTLLVVPVLVFLVLLTNKLDGDISMNYSGVVSPLFVSYVTLLLLTFSAKGGNKWWFGIRKDFSQFLQEYANMAYSTGRASEQNDGSSSSNNASQQPIIKEKNHKKSDLMKPVVPVISIEMPD